MSNIEWIDATAMEDVPADDVIGVVVAGRHIALYNAAGRIYATDNICTHGQARLCDGFLDGHEIECPLHQGKFDVRTGQPSCAPVTEAIRSYPVKIEAGRVFLALDLAVLTPGPERIWPRPFEDQRKPSMRQIDVHKLSDKAEFNGFHKLVLFWCALIIIFDGYDLAVAGIALPSIMKSMGVNAASAGFMVSSGLFGMMFGNILFGTLADRIGRRWVVAICIALFSVFTAAVGFTNDPIVFSVARFVAGVGIGGVMPNVVAQMTEYSPLRIRSTLVTLMFSGYSVGGILAALVGKGLIESYGWQSVFIAAGLPVLLIPLILKSFPESMPFLIKKGRIEELKRIVARMQPSYQPQMSDRFALPSEDKADSAPIRHLFHEGRGFSTVMFWLAFLLCLFMVYGLSSWLTKLMASAGYSLGSALTFVLVLNFGAMIGAVAGGWLADRFHIRYVLAGMYVVAAASIALLGHKMPTEALFLLVGLAGASTIGTQIVNLAYAGQFYPMAVRSTGLGWALGVGRIGAILAPIVIGVLVGMAMPLQQNFMAIAIPALIAAIAISLIDHSRSGSAHHEDVASSLPDPIPAGAGAAQVAPGLPGTGV